MLVLRIPVREEGCVRERKMYARAHNVENEVVPKSTLGTQT